MVLIVVILVLFISLMYFVCNVRRDDDASFWRRLYEAISMKVVDYYCTGSATKNVSIYLKGIFGMYGIVALGYPTIKAFRQASDDKSFWAVFVSWDGVSTIVTGLFVFATTVVMVVYLITHRFEKKATKAILDTDERTKRIEEQNERILQQNDEILGKLVDNSIKELIAKIDGISSLETRNEAILRVLYQLIQNETNNIILCTDRVLRHGGIDWWSNIENRRELRKQIELLRTFILKYQVYIREPFYNDVMNHYELSVNLQNELDSLVMAIATADNPDGITDVYYITYEQEIDWTADFVAYMMGKLQEVDKHPAYEDFAKLYREHEESKNRLLAEIDGKVGKAI